MGGKKWLLKCLLWHPQWSSERIVDEWVDNMKNCLYSTAHKFFFLKERKMCLFDFFFKLKCVRHKLHVHFLFCDEWSLKLMYLLVLHQRSVSGTRTFTVVHALCNMPIVWHFTGVLHTIWGDDATNPDVLKSPAASLRKWLMLLPQSVAQQVDLALGQERPFMPPDMTPEMMAEPNTTVPSMNHMEIICVSVSLFAADLSSNTTCILPWLCERTTVWSFFSFLSFFVISFLVGALFFSFLDFCERLGY